MSLRVPSISLSSRARRWSAAGALLCASIAAASAVQTGAQAQSDMAARTDALFKDLRWRNIGPANMAGRVTDIDAVEANPAIVYVAAASGGVWKSVNAANAAGLRVSDSMSSASGASGRFAAEPKCLRARSSNTSRSSRDTRQR